ncbi:MAG: hypothetical protein ABSD20_17870 [Terriglobales bacterium]
MDQIVSNMTPTQPKVFGNIVGKEHTAGEAWRLCRQPRRTGWADRKTAMHYKIRFTFSARQVREHDLNTFLDVFQLGQMPDVALPRYEDALKLDIETAEGDLRPPYVIPEIRRHLRQLAKHWPHAAFCCDLGTPFLLQYALCQLDHLEVVEWQEAQRILVSFRVQELYRYCQHGNAQIRAAGRRARMSRSEVMHREIAFTRYLLRGLRPTIRSSQGS